MPAAGDGCCCCFYYCCWVANHHTKQAVEASLALRKQMSNRYALFLVHCPALAKHVPSGRGLEVGVDGYGVRMAVQWFDGG